MGFMGICTLCGKTATLQSSHYLPAAFFRRLHSGGLPPTLLDAQAVVYRARQPQAHLLCGKCEHRFKTQGEDWVIDCTCKTTGGFPLRDLLLRNEPVGSMSPNVATAFWYHGARLPKVRHSEIIYFAASVFWRGCAYDWSRVDSGLSRLEFTQALEAEFRSFLLGKAAFPSSVLLQVEVAFDPFLSGQRLGIIFPSRIVPRGPTAGARPGGDFFALCGMIFSLYFDLGRPGGLEWGKVTSIAEPPHPLLLTNVRMSEVAAAHQELESTATPKGRLARPQTRR